MPIVLNESTQETNEGCHEFWGVHFEFFEAHFEFSEAYFELSGLQFEFSPACFEFLTSWRLNIPGLNESSRPKERNSSASCKLLFLNISF